jgi:signal transduction histidine kinase
MEQKKPNEKVNILLVDDQPSKLLSYEAILAELEENLVKATSAREALEHLLKDDFAVILVDVCMPEQDGFELVETIRQHHRFEKTAILFVSAIQLDDIDRVKGYASGAVDYISVPIVPEILRAKVAVFVDLYRKTRQLEQMNEELERRVEERTAELLAKEEALREADRRKDEFLATLAHELRNPLAPLRNSLDIIRMGDVTSALVRQACDTMGRQLSQMTRLIDDLMDVGRITRNKLELRLETVELADIVRSAVESSRPALESARQNLVEELPGSPLPVRADPVRLAQVVANLLQNASKYSPVESTIHMAVQADGDDLIVRVRDHGIGLERSELPHVFEPFFQVKGAAERAPGGLGIGLTLVRSIVKMHGGTVEARSPGPGKGTEFIVCLPGAVVREKEAPSAPSPAPAKRSSGNSLRILVVDDNQDAAESLMLLLQCSGHEVQVAHDGEQALLTAQSFLPELVFMDLGMPGLNGFEAARRVRREKWGQDVMLVALTGWGQEADRRRSAEAWFDKHLVKPVEYEEVDRLIGILAQRRAAHA